MPIEVCPSERRCAIAWSTATASSHDDAGKAEALDRGVDEDRGQAALGQPCVVAVWRVFLGVQAAREHDARDLLLEQELDVVRLGDAAGRLRAQDRREPALGETDAHDLGDGREDRVLELGQDEADEPGALAAQLGRPLVAEDVERREHGLARGLGDPGLAVEDAADRRLADADLACHLCESSCHGVMILQDIDSRLLFRAWRRAAFRAGWRPHVSSGAALAAVADPGRTAAAGWRAA